MNNKRFMSTEASSLMFEEESESEKPITHSSTEYSKNSEKEGKSFFLNRGQIEVLGEDITFDDKTDLEILEITNNVISKIQNLEILQNLIKLNLSFNRIETLENLEDTQIIELNLSHNRIHTIFLIKAMKNMKKLNISFNMLEKFGKVDFFPSLEELDVSNCFFTDFSSLSGLQQLKKMNLSNNRICDEMKLDCSSLTSLDVSHNNLTTISSFAGLSRLQELDISYNPIQTQSFNCGFSLIGVKKLTARGTAITSLKLINTTFPNLEKVDLRENSGIKEEDVYEFVSGARKLTSLDICGSEVNDAEGYREFRKNVLKRANNFPFEFDGKVANSAEDDEQFETPKETLQKLIIVNNKLRGELGIEEREIDIEKLNENEINELIDLIEAENEEFSRKLSEPKDFEEKKELALKILRDIERMKAKMEQREKREIKLPELTPENIDAFIAKIVERFRRIREQYEKHNLITDNDLIIKCEQKILQKASNPMLPDEPTQLHRSSREYSLVLRWLSLKMQREFSVQKIVKLNTFREFIEKSDKYKWMQLVVTISQDAPFSVVSDHCGFFTEGKYKFVIYALDSGKQVVSYQEREDLIKLQTHSKHRYDTKLINYKGKQAIFVNNVDRMVPLYSVRIFVK